MLGPQRAGLRESAPTDELDALPRSFSWKRNEVLEDESEVSAITHLYAGVPVGDLETSIDWYTRLFGRDPRCSSPRLPGASTTMRSRPIPPACAT